MQPRLAPAVRILLWAIGIGFLIQLIARAVLKLPLESILGFTPVLFVQGWIWQIATYPFLHGGLMHLFFNGLVLYSFGSQLEFRWGTKPFLKFFTVCALGGALLQTLIWVASIIFFPDRSGSLGNHPIIGASGALYGLLMAVGMLYGDSILHLFMLVPVRARHFVIILAAIEIFSALGDPNSGVAHLVHLGGLVAGFIYLKIKGPDLRGGGGGGGGWFRKKKSGLSREEVRKRLNLIVNNDKNASGENRDGKMPITWN
jgi:membrane associated rhomboid family serine protease